MGKAKAQIYLGNEALFEKHPAPKKGFEEIPRGTVKSCQAGRCGVYLQEAGGER
jgi:hypothetical protein